MKKILLLLITCGFFVVSHTFCAQAQQAMKAGKADDLDAIAAAKLDAAKQKELEDDKIEGQRLGANFKTLFDKPTDKPTVPPKTDAARQQGAPQAGSPALKPGAVIVPTTTPIKPPAPTPPPKPAVQPAMQPGGLTQKEKMAKDLEALGPVRTTPAIQESAKPATLGGNTAAASKPSLWDKAKENISKSLADDLKSSKDEVSSIKTDSKVLGTRLIEGKDAADKVKADEKQKADAKTAEKADAEKAKSLVDAYIEAKPGLNSDVQKMMRADPKAAMENLTVKAEAEKILAAKEKASVDKAIADKAAAEKAAADEKAIADKKINDLTAAANDSSKSAVERAQATVALNAEKAKQAANSMKSPIQYAKDVKKEIDDSKKALADLKTERDTLLKEKNPTDAQKARLEAIQGKDGKGGELKDAEKRVSDANKPKNIALAAGVGIAIAGVGAGIAGVMGSMMGDTSDVGAGGGAGGGSAAAISSGVTTVSTIEESGSGTSAPSVYAETKEEDITEQEDESIPGEITDIEEEEGDEDFISEEDDPEAVFIGEEVEEDAAGPEEITFGVEE